MPKVIIIGNGIAGDTAAFTLKALSPDFEVNVISEEEYPLYSPCLFPFFLSGELEKDRLFLRKLDDYSKAGINVLLGKKVEEINVKERKIKLSNGSWMSYDYLILATGSFPVVPPIPGADKDGIFTLKTFDDLMNFHQYKKKKVAIIGAGPIGVEVAVSLRLRGVEVALIELLSRVLPRLLDNELSKFVEDILRNAGIEVFTSTRAKEIRGKERVECVITDKGEIPCDAILMATGMRPRNELAAKAGVAVGSRRGIKVDDQMRTNIKNVYACGDCIETRDIVTGSEKLSLLWNTAALQGYIAAANIAGQKKIYPGSLNSTVVKIMDYYVITSGNTSDEFKDRPLRTYDESKTDEHLRLIFADGTLKAVQYVGKKPYRPIGALMALLRRGEFKESLEDMLRVQQRTFHVFKTGLAADQILSLIY